MALGDDWGIAIYVMADDTLSVDLTASREHPAEDTAFILAEGHPAVWSCWLGLNLGAANAKALQRELVDVWGRYKRISRSGEPKYTLRLGLAPVEEE